MMKENRVNTSSESCYLSSVFRKHSVVTRVHFALVINNRKQCVNIDVVVSW